MGCKLRVDFTKTHTQDVKAETPRVLLQSKIILYNIRKGVTRRRFLGHPEHCLCIRRDQRTNYLNLESNRIRDARYRYHVGYDTGACDVQDLGPHGGGFIKRTVRENIVDATMMLCLKREDSGKSR